MSVPALNDERPFMPSMPAEIDAQDFAELTTLVRESCGIDLPFSKKGLVISRLQKRLRQLNLESFSDYLKFLKSDGGTSELEEMICSITTNVTYFNREQHHFEHLRTQVMPDLITRLRQGESIRIWSAGCSNGSEPYTIACNILEAFPEAADYDLRILATDIDRYSLETARAGAYGGDMVESMSADMLSRWFTEGPDGFTVKDKVKRLVKFNNLNLMAPWPMKMKYDIIFCRNVLIYFANSDQVTVFERFSQVLKPQSHLYIGHSERVVGPSAQLFRSVGVTTYLFQSPRHGHDHKRTGH